MGSAILDTYLQFIAENSSNSLGLGLSGKHAAVAAVAAAMNEGDSSKLGEREEDEIGEDRDRGADEEAEDLESSAGEEEDEYSEEEQEAIKAE
jgi:hypothetical protein